MQISYYFALTKIQKLQNFFLKNKKKTFFCTGWYRAYRPVLPEIGWYKAGAAGIFSGTKQGGSNVPDCWPVRYILAVPASTVQNWLPW